MVSALCLVSLVTNQQVNVPPTEWIEANRSMQDENQGVFSGFMALFLEGNSVHSDVSQSFMSPGFQHKFAGKFY